MLDGYCCIPPSRVKYKPVTHVIFDLDGTILDSESCTNESIAQVALKYEKTLTPEIRVKLDGIPLPDKIAIAIAEMDLPVTVEEIQPEIEKINLPKLSQCPLMPGVEKLITHLGANNVPMAIATSSSQEGYDIKTKKLPDLFGLFDHVVCSETDPEVEHGKPAPDIFRICASRFPDRPYPRNCLVIEDSAQGVAAALAAKMQVVMVPNQDVPYEVWKTATLRLDSLEFMMPELFGLPAFPREDAEISEVPAVV